MTHAYDTANGAVHVFREKRAFVTQAQNKTPNAASAPVRGPCFFRHHGSNSR